MTRPLTRSIWSVLSRMARFRWVVTLSKSVLNTYMREAGLWEDFLPDRRYILPDRLNDQYVVKNVQPEQGLSKSVLNCSIKLVFGETSYLAEDTSLLTD